jgi:hypothetical protein
LTTTFGFEAVYDRDRGRYAHPAAAFVVTRRTAALRAPCLASGSIRPICGSRWSVPVEAASAAGPIMSG